MSMTFYAAYSHSSGKLQPLDSVEGLNFNNRNGADIARNLGLACDAGGIDPVDIGSFLQRCINFQRRHLGRPDPGIEAESGAGAAGCRFVDCARDAGTLQRHIARLQAMARTALDAGATHIYAG